jgi:hypothetical protein
VLAELRVRCADTADLVAVEQAPDDLITVALPAGPPVPVDLLVGAACAMRDREIATQQSASPGAYGSDRQPPGVDERGAQPGRE